MIKNGKVHATQTQTGKGYQKATYDGPIGEAKASQECKKKPCSVTIKADHNNIKAEAKQHDDEPLSVHVNKDHRYDSDSNAHPRQHVSARYNKRNKRRWWG